MLEMLISLPLVNPPHWDYWTTAVDLFLALEELLYCTPDDYSHYIPTVYEVSFFFISPSVLSFW